ncbi:MAG: metal-dependent hydrolase [Alphaproteobacteria bacterium]|nr:metal-dependent hydrolase [Alphaproteobacteria bacterium]MCB9791125.1 metal-dependent hydrolase [Alphaproteobacteria bacterium]
MSLTVRKPDVRPPTAAPRAWLNGNVTVSRFFDAAGIVIGPMERFGVRVIRRLRGRVPAMDATLRGFCGQESQHSRIHRRFDAALAAQGLRFEPCVARQERLLRWVERRCRPRLQLSIVVALEHNFASLGDLVLRDRVMDGAEPEHRDLWEWHGVEELEHKAVAFRLYQALGAPWWHRQLGLVLASLLMWLPLIHTALVLLRQDPGFSAARRRQDRAAWLAAGHATLWQLAARYARPYLSPSYDPDQIDHSALIAETLARLEPRLAAAGGG